MLQRKSIFNHLMHFIIIIIISCYFLIIRIERKIALIALATPPFPLRKTNSGYAPLGALKSVQSWRRQKQLDAKTCHLSFRRGGATLQLVFAIPDCAFVNSGLVR